jgi:TRAP-type C4-dicarboxylate transport system permease large subunit
MFFVLFGALLFANFINIAGGARALSDFVIGLDTSPIWIIVAVCGIYMVLGCMLESLSMMLLTVPLFAPIMQSLGVDLVWFGIIVVVAVEVSLITPPIGLNVFVLQAAFPDVSVARVFRGIVPFFVSDLIRLALLVLIPGIALYLPSLMH